MISQGKFLEIGTFIEENILHSSVWDEAEEKLRRKAVNNSVLTLTRLLARYFPNPEEISVDILANQSVWILRVDDTFLRAEMGASYIQMSGVMVNIKDRDRSICPYVLDVLGITPDPITGGLSKRKVGRYSGKQNGSDYSIFRRG